VLDSDVKSFGDDSVSDLFVNNNADGSGIHVEDGSGSSVIVLVWHALVDGTIDNDIDNISDLEGGQILGDVDGSVTSESFLEFVSGSSFISVTMGHGSKILINIKNKYLYSKFI
jgi:hypothetical protein